MSNSGGLGAAASGALADVLQAKPLRQDVIDLHRPQLPIALEDIAHDKVELGAIEGGLAWLDTESRRRFGTGFVASSPHFPTTLGSEFNPSPSGNFEVTSVTREPWFHYQPELLNEGSGEDYRIPPGPNSPVGVVWIALSKPHYGIHGTSAPETIGYAVSHGCIRLTNWDARFVADQVSAGVPVEFIDVGEEPVALAR